MMRTAAEFRERKLKTLALALRRPALFCGYGRYADLFFCDIIRDLSWLEDREDAFDAVASQLLKGCLRVYGQFHFQHHLIPDECCNEIASTYAEAAFQLDLFAPARLLTEAEFADLQSAIDDDFLATDHTESELVVRFGPPTHDVLGGDTTVHSYGCDNRSSRWIHFDYDRRAQATNLASTEFVNDPVLRDVRRKNNEFELLPIAGWRRHSRPEDDDEFGEEGSMS